jgi:hypothetical protein
MALKTQVWFAAGGPSTIVPISVAPAGLLAEDSVIAVWDIDASPPTLVSNFFNNAIVQIGNSVPFYMVQGVGSTGPAVGHRCVALIGGA